MRDLIITIIITLHSLSQSLRTSGEISKDRKCWVQSQARSWPSINIGSLPFLPLLNLLKLVGKQKPTW